MSSNYAGNDGGAIFSLLQDELVINHGNFSNNTAGNEGAVFYVSFWTILTIRAQTNEMIKSDHKSTDQRLIIENNRAARGGAIYVGEHSSVSFEGDQLICVRNNTATNLGVIYVQESTLQSSTVLAFEGNVNTIYAEDSNVIFNGSTNFLHCTSSETAAALQNSRGTITSIRSDIFFDGNTNFEHNVAESGGAIHATESNVTMNGETVIVNNTAKQNGGAILLYGSKLYLRGSNNLTGNQAYLSGGAVHSERSNIIMFDESNFSNNKAQNGGSIYLQISELNFKGVCNIIDNEAAKNGGGLDAINSSIVVESVTQFINNEAQRGGGSSLARNTKFDLRTSGSPPRPVLMFTDNRADKGGALFIDDKTNPTTCTSGSDENNTLVECFFLTATNDTIQYFQFSNNFANISGANLFGGLLDRCAAGESHQHQITESVPNGLDIFLKVSNLSNSDTISSDPVRVCVCSNGWPNCSSQSYSINITGEEMSPLWLAALDEADHLVNATIHISLNGTQGKCQTVQELDGACTKITYDSFTFHVPPEMLNIYADGPCEDNGISTQNVEMKVLPCTCPIGFQKPAVSSWRCVCECDPDLAPYITECDQPTASVTRTGNFWLTYVNTTSRSSGYLIHPNCPLNYCQPPSQPVKVNLNHPNGSDSLCKTNRGGLLCGTCQKGLRLSLSSSRCIPCPDHWPGLMVVILIVALLAGIGLVATLLVLNLTVAIGTLNALIFYANIVEAYKNIFFPSATISPASVIISWLNLELGFDVCFFDHERMDKYTKTWLQLAFPAYLIILVIFVTIVAKYSDKFAQFIGKNNPVETLATLILLSYAKFLQIVITALSFAKLEYPDGSSEIIWLPDATVKYFTGKHAVLFFTALIIILIGVLFTFLLISWQWLPKLSGCILFERFRNKKCIKLPKWRLFMWIKQQIQVLQIFMKSYTEPYSVNHRYWTGLLLLARVVLYLTSAINVSGDPQITFVTLLVIVGCLMAPKWSIYEKEFINILESVTYINLLIFTAFSWYTHETGKNQSVAAHISVAVTLFQLFVVIIYHVRTYTINKFSSSKENSTTCESTAAGGCDTVPTSPVIGESVVSIPKRKCIITGKEENPIHEGLANIESPTTFTCIVYTEECETQSLNVNDIQTNAILEEISA